MSDYLTRLVLRALAPAETIRPRTGSVFEPPADVEPTLEETEAPTMPLADVAAAPPMPVPERAGPVERKADRGRPAADASAMRRPPAAAPVLPEAPAVEPVRPSRPAVPVTSRGDVAPDLPLAAVVPEVAPASPGIPPARRPVIDTGGSTITEDADRPSAREPGLAEERVVKPRPAVEVIVLPASRSPVEIPPAVPAERPPAVTNPPEAPRLQAAEEIRRDPRPGPERAVPPTPVRPAEGDAVVPREPAPAPVPATRAAPTIRVTIGRVEVRAVTPEPARAASRPVPESRRPRVALEEYLERREAARP